MGTVVIVDHEQHLADTLRQALPTDRHTTIEAHDRSADAVHRVAASPDVDAVVLGPGAQEPVRVAQQIHAADRHVAIILVAEPERHSLLTRAIQFAPYLGDDVRCLVSSGATQLVEQVVAAVRRTRQRRSYRRTITAVSARLPSSQPGSPPASQYLGRLLDIAPVGIGVVDERGAIVGWNRQAAALTQRSEQQVLGTYLEHLFPLAERPRVRRILAQWTTHVNPVGPEVLEVAVNERGLRRFEFTGAAVPGPGWRSGLVVFQDVTERVEAAERERQALAAAEAALRSRDEFLGIAAHELKTPVTTLKGSVQLLLRLESRGAIDRERLRRGLLTIDAVTSRLTVLINDLLDVARIRMGYMEMHLREADLGVLARTIAERYADELRDNGQELVVRTDPQCPVLLDAVRFEQVLDNLLSNAAKYSRPGATIVVTVRNAESGVLLEVCDQGIGFPQEAAETIFTPFGRATNATKDQIQGMGLGLYICRKIVGVHGGRIWAESPGEGQGACFRVWLPQAGGAEEGDAGI